MNGLKIAEYMPKSFRVGYYIIVFILIVCMFATVFIFNKQLEQLNEKREVCTSYAEKIENYKSLMSEAEEYFNNKEYETAAQLYFSVIDMHPLKNDVYLHLSYIYEYHKEYETAVEILNLCPEEIRDNTFNQKLLSLNETIKELQKSIFRTE